ncbi:hypothetical protein Q4S27_02580 [Morganella morganii subsp. sibonii]
MSLYQPQKKNKLKVIVLLLAVLAIISGFIYSQKTPSPQTTTEKPVVIAYQAIIDPGKIAQANHAYETATGRPII